jgi:DNA repair exonuclease SbcCD nuclease subunit
MSKIAVVSDLHLGVHQNSEKWLNESLKFAKWFREELFQKSVRDIIIPGDFFHDRTDINLMTIQYATRVLEEWKDFRIWMIPGNHDCFYKDNATVTSVSLFKGYPNVKLFEKTETLIRDKRNITFVPWGDTLDNAPKSDVIIGHFELNGFKMNSFKMCEGGEDCDHILDKGDIVLTGHFHLRQERRSKKGLVLYVGTPYEMDYNDMGSDKGYHILDLSSLGVEFVEYPHTTKHKKIKVSDLIAHKDNLNDYLTKEVKGNVVTFVVDRELDFDKIGALVQKLQLYEPLAFKGTDVIRKTENAIDTVNQQVTVQTEQLITEFVKGMELEDSEEVLKLVLELYSKYKTT